MEEYIERLQLDDLETEELYDQLDSLETNIVQQIQEPVLNAILKALSEVLVNQDHYPNIDLSELMSHFARTSQDDIMYTYLLRLDEYLVDRYRRL